jgi:hypothetical protein
LNRVIVASGPENGGFDERDLAETDYPVDHPGSEACEGF